MLMIFSPDLDLTNSLFMKRPIGCLYSRPFGALRLMNRSEVIMYEKVEDVLVAMMKIGEQTSDFAKR